MYEPVCYEMMVGKVYYAEKYQYFHFYQFHFRCHKNAKKSFLPNSLENLLKKTRFIFFHCLSILPPSPLVVVLLGNIPRSHCKRHPYNKLRRVQWFPQDPLLDNIIFGDFFFNLIFILQFSCLQFYSQLSSAENNGRSSLCVPQ